MARFQKNNSQIYTEKLFAQETPQLQSIREQLEKDNDWAMHISPMEGKILQLLVHLSKPKTIVEIGTLYGYSTLWMAEAAPKDTKIYAFERMEAFYNIAKENFKQSKFGDNIEIYWGEALQQLKKIKGPFDLIFIDADKSHYIDFLDWAEENINSGGIIVGDNTFLFGHMYGEGSDIPRTTQTQRNNMKIFNERLADSSKYHSIILPTQEGMTVAIKK